MLPSLNAYLCVACLLLAIGSFGLLFRRNSLILYLCLELMLMGVNLAFVAVARFNGTMDGAVFVFFTMTVAAAEIAVGLVLIVALYRRQGSLQIDAYRQLRD